MWLNSTLVFSGVFGVFSMGGREVGGVPGDISGSGVFLWDFRGGRWRVWEKPCTDPSVDKRSRERSPLSLSLSLFFLPASLSLSFLLSFSPVDRTISNRNRIRFPDLGGRWRGGLRTRALSRVNDCSLDRPTTTLGVFWLGSGRDHSIHIYYVSILIA